MAHQFNDSEKTIQPSWRNCASAARQVAGKDPNRSSTLYKTAIAECRITEGPNSEDLAELCEEFAQLCIFVNSNADAKRYLSQAAQIRLFNQQQNSLQNMQRQMQNMPLF